MGQMRDMGVVSYLNICPFLQLPFGWVQAKTIISRYKMRVNILEMLLTKVIIYLIPIKEYFPFEPLFYLLVKFVFYCKIFVDCQKRQN